MPPSWPPPLPRRLRQVCRGHPRPGWAYDGRAVGAAARQRQPRFRRAAAAGGRSRRRRVARRRRALLPRGVGEEPRVLSARRLAPKCARREGGHRRAPPARLDAAAADVSDRVDDHWAAARGEQRGGVGGGWARPCGGAADRDDAAPGDRRRVVRCVKCAVWRA
eukprot:356244-Chlamydomonas_euryale.AAC.7